MKEVNELRKVFADNLKYYTSLNGKKMSDVARDLKMPISTVNDWYSGKNYPKIEAIQKLADYFFIKKSDLIEEKCLIKEAKTIKEINYLKVHKHKTEYLDTIELTNIINELIRAVNELRKDKNND